MTTFQLKPGTAVERMFIGGETINTANRSTRFDLESPIDETPLGHVMLGNAADVDAAVKSARAAFEEFSQFSLEERIALLERFKAVYEPHHEELAQLVTTEIGAPITFSRNIHAGSPMHIIDHTIMAMKKYPFEEMTPAGTQIVREPIGVCGLITPWNFPIHQIICKVAPALATGCTMVLKPSELSPFSADAFAEIFHKAGYPDGVFNVVHGDGPTVGAAIAAHPDIDMVSFTGSTRAGKLVAIAAADSVKRVHQELGGKSAAIMLSDADIDTTVPGCFFGTFGNSGQACISWSRFLVPEDKHDEVAEAAKTALEAQIVGDPYSEETNFGAMSNKAQFDKVQRLIEIGIREGATLMTGGTGRPNGIQRGYFTRPTLFANVTPDMTIANEEIFGPVLSIMPYKDDEDAIRIANSTIYGLSGAVFSKDLDRARHVASRMRTGMVHINGSFFDFDAPFGGYRQSGNGREWGHHGLEDYLEVKAVMGYADGIGSQPIN